MTKRTLTLIRHAKSSWNNPSLSDFERPLNKRGLRDAPRVGSALQQDLITFDRVLCSDARRARQTLFLLQDSLEIDEEDIDYRHDMYGANAEHLLACISKQDDSIYNLALVGHNPGMEDMANGLAAGRIGSMPTCCVVQLSYQYGSWGDISRSQAELVFMLRPREL